MPTIQGPGAAVTMPTGFNMKANQIDGTLEIPAAEDTGFSDNGYYSGKPAGPVKISGTVAGVMLFNASTTAPVPSALLASTLAPSNASGSLTLQIMTGCTLAFTANILGWTFSRNVREAARSSYNYESVGQPVMTWDETA